VIALNHEVARLLEQGNEPAVPLAQRWPGISAWTHEGGHVKRSPANGEA